MLICDLLRTQRQQVFVEVGNLEGVWEVQAVDDLLGLLLGVVSELAHVLAQLLAHRNRLVKVAVCRDDVSPVVLELQVPPLRLFFALVLFQLLLVQVVLHYALVDSIHCRWR